MNITHHPSKNLATRVAAKLEEGHFKGCSAFPVPWNPLRQTTLKPCQPLGANTQHRTPTHPHHHNHWRTKYRGCRYLARRWLEQSSPFPCGSAGGPDGLRPQHLKLMVCSSAGGGAPRLQRALTAFINLVVEGKTASSFLFLWGFPCCPGEETDGGVRPIVVGCTL